MDAQDRAQLHAIVSGLVQGVGFRQYAMEQAFALGLTGWVMNRRDRKVEVVAEGPRADLEEFLHALRDGPPAAMVRDVEADWTQATGKFVTFIVR
jgi:acylphosphatase